MAPESACGKPADDDQDDGFVLLQPEASLALVDEKQFIGKKVVPFLLGLEASKVNLSAEQCTAIKEMKRILNAHTIAPPYEDFFKYMPENQKKFGFSDKEMKNGMKRASEIYRQVYEAHFTDTLALFQKLFEEDVFYKEQQWDFEVVELGPLPHKVTPSASKQAQENHNAGNLSSLFDHEKELDNLISITRTEVLGKFDVPVIYVANGLSIRLDDHHMFLSAVEKVLRMHPPWRKNDITSNEAKAAFHDICRRMFWPGPTFKAIKNPVRRYMEAVYEFVRKSIQDKKKPKEDLLKHNIPTFKSVKKEIIDMLRGRLMHIRAAENIAVVAKIEMTAGTERILDAIRAMHNDVLKAVEDQRSSNRAVMGKFAETQMLIQLKGIHKLASPHVQMAQGKFSAEVEDLDPRLKIPVKTRRALVEIDGLLMDANLRKNMNILRILLIFDLAAIFETGYLLQALLWAQLHWSKHDPQLRTITSIEERDSQIYTPEQDDPEIQDYDAVPLNLQHRLQQEHLRIPLNKLPGFYAAVEQYAALHLTAAEMDKISQGKLPPVPRNHKRIKLVSLGCPSLSWPPERQRGLKGLPFGTECAWDGSSVRGVGCSSWKKERINKLIKKGGFVPKEIVPGEFVLLLGTGWSGREQPSGGAAWK
ncbi:unnamed protein product [Notodromas monacha]|uniref:Uncharacterized protein n=1 Tax=Notodromas monacha TaxID=399045 RepID=A0A7R9BLH8_9CRUS|nr:unnamed protein product [Notodromas monacha]CAG0917682.1 unnamed protein product [Notodromas monacha]